MGVRAICNDRKRSVVTGRDQRQICLVQAGRLVSQYTHAHFSFSPVQYFSYRTLPGGTTGGYHHHHPKKGDNFQQFYHINLNVYVFFIKWLKWIFFLNQNQHFSQTVIVTNYTTIQKFGVNKCFLRSNNTFIQQVKIEKNDQK